MPTAKNILTVMDITLIIKACAENSVSKFKLDTLEIEFGEYKNKDTVIIAPLTQEAHDKLDNDTLVSEELKTKEERMQMMLIENPLLAEELIANGDLEDDGTDDGRTIEGDGEES